jgi:Zn-dependent protease/CBS domain-containing protein
MFGRAITLFTLLGFEVKVDASWLFLALLVTWSLATGYFPSAYPGVPGGAYWAMGVTAAAGLFGSIVFHELSHSLVARRFALPIRGITLFIFGGVAEMDAEPQSPRAELLVAVAGPISSGFLALGFGALAGLAEGAGLGAPVHGTLAYLALLNGLLALFNLVPAFPLDGGRVLRAILWARQGDLQGATRTASRVGSGFGMVLIALGALNVLTGNLVAGIWWVLIGMFVRGAASASYTQMVTRKALAGEPVRRFMTADPVTVGPEVSVAELVEDYVYRYHHELFPVLDDGRLAGCVTVREVKALARERWGEARVRDLVRPCAEDNTIEAGTDAVEALQRMNRTGSSRLMVTEGGRLAGIITLKDLVALLTLKMDLEGEGEP